MERSIQALLSTILIVTLYSTTLLQLGIAEVNVTPRLPFIPADVSKCWSSLFDVQGCVIEIYNFSITRKTENLRWPCCKAILHVDTNCWPKMLPLTPLFPPLLKNVCARVNGGVGSDKKPQVPTIPGFSLPGSPVDVKKCWSSLISVEGCVTEIYKSVFTGKCENVGAVCCKAASALDAKCWPHMFPLNPLFPPLLKDTCSRINAATPTPT
ncbi:unnamed protein product [Microthlaspi erraticum]|uniref:Prolamin-like domain-containing protein n=1 Tax=Microthlaspi erraticum TaxID=1685480 RepID=A0A6D2KBE9_9BRAS|nr:unnamed protein product [Microthlaspi erraticum]